MIQHSREAEEVKNRSKKVAEGCVMGFSTSRATDTGVNEIDPAELFDPEECGTWRRDSRKP